MQAELTFEDLRYEECFGQQTYRRLLELRHRLDPAGTLTRGLVEPG